MPRKPFEDAPYDPIAADLAREVAAAGRGVALPSASSELSGPRRAEANTAIAVRTLALPSVRSPAQEVGARIAKRFIMTRKEDDDLNAFLLRLQTKGETKVTLSVIVRSALSILMQAEEQILNEIGDRFPQEFPSTHDSLALGEFEDHWTRILLKALRRLPRSNPL